MQSHLKAGQVRTPLSFSPLLRLSHFDINRIRNESQQAEGRGDQLEGRDRKKYHAFLLTLKNLVCHRLELEEGVPFNGNLQLYERLIIGWELHIF